MSSSAVRRAGSGSISDQLSVEALGLALVLLVSVAWGTGLFYLVARLGLPSPVGLVWIDGLHVYVGLVGAVVIVGKVLRVGLKYRVRGVPNVVPWQRWMSWSLFALYGVIFATGVLVLLPIAGPTYANLVELHLLSSVWALVPTTWHVWHYRRRAAPHLVRFLRRARGRRFWAGFALAMAPALVVSLQPRGVSQLPRVMGGTTWSQAGLKGTPISHVMTTPDGSTLLAGGDKLYMTRNGTAWTSIGFPSTNGFVPVQPGTDIHVHGALNTVTTIIQALAVGSDGIYAGTAQGLFLRPASGGTFVDLRFPASNVTAIMVDPANPGALWTASAAGVMLSSDGGHTWADVGAGLARPETVSSITYRGSQLFASDATGVFEWKASARTWVHSSNQASVVSLTASPDGRALYAASSSGELRVLVGGIWQALGKPGTTHLHAGQVHETLRSVLPMAGRLYAVGTTDGVSASADGGKTWTQLGGGVATRAPGQVVAFHGQLVAATSDGVYRYVLAYSPPPSVTWWVGLLAAALVAGPLSLAVVGLDWVRPLVVRKRPTNAEPDYQFRSSHAHEPGYEYERPFLGVEVYIADMIDAPSPPPPEHVESRDSCDGITRWGRDPLSDEPVPR